jgi:hypothetical protein
MLLQGRATNVKDMLRTGGDELNAAGRVGGEFRVIFAWRGTFGFDLKQAARRR